MNMSELGNASFKPAGTMCLVHAAKYDVSSMMLQESQIDMFQRNLIPCTGRAPTKETRDAKDRAQQLRVAEDFANIFDNVEEVLSEVLSTAGSNLCLSNSSLTRRDALTIGPSSLFNFQL